MLFNRKSKKELKCHICNSKISKEYSFCPFCGASFIDAEKEMRDFGMLGKDDISEIGNQHFGFTDKIIGSLVNSLMKNLDKQFKEFEKTEMEGRVRAIPAGIKITFGGPMTQKPHKKHAQKKVITEEQIQKMTSLPRATAKSNVKRLSDKIVYELATPGLQSVNDVFVSKTESGYEIKAIGDKKIYVNSIPINLPIRGYSIADNKLFVEFLSRDF